MSTVDERTLAALRLLLRRSHLAAPDDLATLVSGAGRQLGADRAVLYLADYDQLLLIPLNGPGVDEPAEAVTIEGTLAGRAFSDVIQHHTTGAGGAVLWTPVLDGTDRLGVLQLEFPRRDPVDEALSGGAFDVASLLAELIVTRSAYGDAVERARRRIDMTLPAELQWQLLPPLTFVSPRVAISGILAPAAEVAGDSFDYALNGDIAHVAVFDAMGHGLEATLLAAVALSALRNARRGGHDLGATVRAVDAAVAAQFPVGKFLTGIVGELDVSTGWWRWITCGHPPALLIREGRVVKQLDSVTGVALGLGMQADPPPMDSERLHPGDRLLLYTDGVTEARNARGQFFGTARLVEFVTRQAADGRPVAETLRRLNHAILDHHDGKLQDDATTLIVEWATDEPRRTVSALP